MNRNNFIFIVAAVVSIWWINHNTHFIITKILFWIATDEIQFTFIEHAQSAN